jgi:hypothetical protein
VPVGTETIVARARKRGGLLEIDGATPLEVRFGKDVAPARAVIESAAGMWRLDRVDKTETAVLDASGAAIAAIDYATRPQHVVLAGGERIPFTASGLFALRRYRLGEDLFVAGAALSPFREFTARISPELAGRADRALLIGLAAAFTHWRIRARSSVPSNMDRTYYQ